MKIFTRKFSVLLALLFSITNIVKAQFWTEDFSDFNTTPSSVANGFIGLNGMWTETQLAGNTGADANKFFISCTEAGMLANNCASGCPTGPVPPPSPFLFQSLHIGSVPSTYAFLCLLGDCGALYNAGDGGLGLSDASTEVRVESPSINCTGKTNIVLTFNYIEFGDGSNDNAETWYYNGSSWSLLVDMSKTACGNGTGGPCNTVACGNSTRGIWTQTSNIFLPASANNNPAIKIGFRWVNNNDGVGTDPSFAVADIKLAVNGTVGLLESNYNNSAVISPNPTTENAKLFFYAERNGSAEIQLCNYLGQVVHFEKINFNAGNNSKFISLENTPAGNYTLRIIGNELNLVKSIVKL